MQHGLAGHVSGLPGVFWVVFAGQLVNRVGSMIVPFLVYYLTSEGMSTASAGLVLAALGLGGLVSQPLGGVLTDRIGIRFTLVAGLLTAGLSIAALGVAAGLPTVLAAAVLVGATADIYRPAAAALVATVVDRADRARAFSLIYWAINMGVAVAGLLGGLLADRGYWLLFVLESGTSVAFAVLVAAAVPRLPAAAARPRMGGGPAHPAGSGVLRDRLFGTLVVLNLANGLITAQITVGIPLATRADGHPASLYGAVFLVCGLLIGIGQPPLTVWLARFDRPRVLALSWAVFGIGMALNGLAGPAWSYLAVTVVWTLGEIGAASFAGSLVADLAPAGTQGRYQSAYGWSFALAQLIGPLLGVALYEGIGPGALWWACALLGVVTGVAGLLLAPAVHACINLRSRAMTSEFTT